MRGVNTAKLLILAILGFCAIVLGSAVLTLQIYVTRETQRLGLLGRNIIGVVQTKTRGSTAGGTGSSSSSATTTRTSTSTTFTGPNHNHNQNHHHHNQGEAVKTTTRPSQPITTKDIHLKESSVPPHGRSFQTAGAAYWRQAAAFLQEWDALLEQYDDYALAFDDMDGSPTEESPPLIPQASNKNKHLWNPQFALQEAANAGHPMAQHYWANAHASGIWPVPKTTTNSSSSSMDENDEDSLHVFDEWSPTAHGDHPQLTKAFLLWHMAAVGGNIESAMALAHRISELADDSSESKIDPTTDDTAATTATADSDNNQACQQVLPYLEAAAHGIMDQLEASPHSRAKVLPPMDKHVLAQVHMHGETSSQLDWNNKPHESKEAIQFYHLKATTTPWTARFYKEETTAASASTSTSTSSEEATIDVQAAYTLAHLYHYGLRGVPQNLTQSLLYYEIAGIHGHWESAGEAGTFYLWGMGTSQNVQQAWDFFRIGAPFGFEGCRRKYEQTLVKKSGKDAALSNTEISECDATSLNGLGVLHLLGIPQKVPVDLVTAEKYFALAKEMDNTDAMYNLSMMWLGWKTHFKHIHELENDGISLTPDEAFPITSKSKHKKATSTFALHYSKRTDGVQKGPTQSEIQDAIKLLTVAANKGHVQAKHRLAMIYGEGIQIQTAAMKYDAVKPSCVKARGLYQWITEHGSLQRSRRLRKAYRAYMDGDSEVSLRNYLAAAETGSNVGQVNAAFLLERGTCLGLSVADCAKASVRLWKAASARGNTEACLRVGDFYYYGRLRGNTLPVGPFGWVQYFLYPEEYLPELLSRWGATLWTKIQGYFKIALDDGSVSDSKEEAKRKPTAEEIKQHQELLESDLSMAAHYYTEGVEKHYSPRANFNLGFMYEWGLGLKQDFPLAKRHYDLAASVNGQGKEAELAVQIARWVMSLHEYFVKLQVSWEDWRLQKPTSKNSSASPSSEKVPPPKASQTSNGGHPVPGTASDIMGKTAQEVILSHVFNWSSLAIAVLLYIVIQLQKFREYRRRRRTA